MIGTQEFLGQSKPHIVPIRMHYIGKICGWKVFQNGRFPGYGESIQEAWGDFKGQNIIQPRVYQWEIQNV